MTERAKILLVDDRPENLLALEAILSSLDQELVRATSGEEALRALLHEDFALILLDAQMPGMDGFETASRIKRRERSKSIPIIFLTAVDTDQRDAYRGYAAGAADYISKPFDPWVLRTKVQVFVELWAKGRQLETQAAFLGRRLREQMDSQVDVLGELSDRVAGVEEALAELGAHSELTGDDAAAVTRLQSRVAALRDAVGALGGAPEHLSRGQERGRPVS